MTNHLPKSKVTETTNLRLSSIVLVRVTDLFEGQVVTIFVVDKITQNYSRIPSNTQFIPMQYQTESCKVVSYVNILHLIYASP